MKKTSKRRPGIVIMGQLIGLVKPLLPVMLLSIMLGVVNVLPIPALDGGHALFCIYEIVTGRKPSDTFLQRAQYVGFFLLLGLLIFANLNDILRLFGLM